MSDQSQSPVKIAAGEVAPRHGTRAYPERFRAICEGRAKRTLGEPFALSQFGVNLTELAPGAATAQRHWHTGEDEFVYVLAGTATLVSEAGETELAAGECAGFPAGRPDGHMIVNRTDAPVRLLEVGGRAAAEEIHYPDIDMHGVRSDGRTVFYRKDGTPW